MADITKKPAQEATEKKLQFSKQRSTLHNMRTHVQSRLDAAQARIEKIVAGTDGKPTGTVPFDADT